MMTHTSFKIALVLTALALTACGEKPQTLGAGKNDVPSYQGTENPFAVSGWKAGDKTSWEQGLRARGLNSQNEYSKTK